MPEEILNHTNDFQLFLLYTQAPSLNKDYTLGEVKLDCLAIFTNDRLLKCTDSLNILQVEKLYIVRFIFF